MLNYIGLAIPFFLMIVFCEWRYSEKLKNGRYNTGNTVMNMAIGALDQIGSLLTFVLLYFVLDYVYENYRFLTLENNWKQWLMAYVAVDFLSYWYHRFSHTVNILWAGHITHHSSAFYNLSNSFRTSIFQGLNRIPFWTILPLFGFSPLVLLITLKISGIYEFFLHTSYIPKLGFLEKIFITPSSHKVHHGKNELYIDKNYGSTFVIWDKLFGTYQEETEEVAFGIKAGYVDNDPIIAIVYHYQYLWKRIRLTPWGMGKIKILYMSPEWLSNHQINVVQTSVRMKPILGNDLKQYAFFQICLTVFGFIFLIVYFELMPGTLAFILAIMVLNSIVNSALFFNNNLSEGFLKRELYRILLFLLVIISFISFGYNLYLWPVIAYQALSLLFFLYSFRKVREPFNSSFEV